MHICVGNDSFVEILSSINYLLAMTVQYKRGICKKKLKGRTWWYQNDLEGGIDGWVPEGLQYFVTGHVRVMSNTSDFPDPNLLILKHFLLHFWYYSYFSCGLIISKGIIPCMFLLLSMGLLYSVRWYLASVISDKKEQKKNVISGP